MSRLSLFVFSILLLVTAMSQFTHATTIECNVFPLMNWTEQDYEIDRRGWHPDRYWCITDREITRLSQWPKDLRDRAPKRFDPTTGKTYCYPTSGGVWESQLDALTLEKLGVNQFKTDASDWHRGREDKWCEQLRVYGGNWYGCNLEMPLEERQLGCPWPLEALTPDLTIRRMVVIESETKNVYVLLPHPITDEYPEGAVVMMEDATTEKEQIEVMKKFNLDVKQCDDKWNCLALEDFKWPPVKWAARYASFEIPDGYRRVSYLD